jgi:hypothetical protein
MWKKPLATVATLGLVMAGTGAVMAGTSSGRTPVNCMDTTSETTPASTSSMNWSDVPGFQANPTAIFPLKIDVSATVSGAPVRFRILGTNVGTQTVVSNPGPTRFDPGVGGPNAFTYQWVEQGDSAAPHADLIQLQWRSPSGGAVSLLRGDMAVLYRTDGCNGEA